MYSGVSGGYFLSLIVMSAILQHLLPGLIDHKLSLETECLYGLLTADICEGCH